MKTLIFISVLLSWTYTAYSQMNNGQFGNEWIDFSRTYYKFKVAEDGIYRIPAAHLQLSGINLGQIAHENIQIFHQGQEIPIHIELNNGNIEFIELYAFKNRGFLDAELYVNQHQHFNPEYSLVTDSSAYFLSWKANVSGKRYQALTSNLSNLPAKEDFYMHRSLFVPNLIWSPGKLYYISGVTMAKSTYEYGEGWGGAKLNNQTITIETPFLYPANVPSKAELRMYSEGSNHNVQFKIAGQNLHNVMFFGDSVHTQIFNFNSNYIQQSTGINIIGNAGSSDRQSISYAAIEYPRYFNFNNKSIFQFKIEASNNRKFLEISNFSNPGLTQNIYLFDLTNGLRIQCFYDPINAKVLTDLPASTVDRTLVLVSFNATNAFSIVGQLKTVNFTNYANHDADYLIIAHSNMFSDVNGNNPVVEYAAYRASKGFNPAIINVQEIFDQFGYGIDIHPQSIRNFSDYIHANWQNPKHVFLIGKGKVYSEIRNHNTYDILIPSFGSPPSDNLLFTRRGQRIPDLAVGRLSIMNGDELRSYLNKIKDMETLSANAFSPKNKSWEKKVIHLGGGVNAMEQQSFGNILNVLKNNIESGNYGAEVYSFFKDNSNVNDPGSHTTLDSVFNDGASIVTYLGHATAESFDYNAYLVDKYTNKNKYPLYISLSCSNGNIFSSETDEMSENFVLAEDKGASSFIGFTQPISLFSANTFCTEFYRLVSNEGYGLSTSELINHSLLNLYGTGLLNELAAHYLVYHGDPALKLSNNTGLDFTLDKENVRTDPELIDNNVDEFDIYFDLYNLGIATDTMVTVNLYRTLPFGDTLFVASQEIFAVKNMKEVKFRVKNGGAAAEGLNLFSIKINELKNIPEAPIATAYKNNFFTFPVFIGAQHIYPVYPANYAMLPDSDITLIATPANVFADEKEYYFEIDTTPLFNSFLHAGASVYGKGGAITWTPSINYLDSVVYFWRVYQTDVDPIYQLNHYSSFMVLQGKTGWNQSNVYQFEQNSFENLKISSDEQIFEYSSRKNEISVVNALTPSTLSAGYVASFFNNNLIDKCRCQNENGIYVMVMDSAFNSWINPGGSTRYGNVNCDPASRPSSLFLFKTVMPEKQIAFENFLRDSIPLGHYVLLYSLNNAGVNNWSNSLINLLQNFGSNEIQNLASSQTVKPWAFFFKKGEPLNSCTTEKAALNSSEIICLDAYIDVPWHSGSMETDYIAGAASWEWLEWNQTFTHNNSNQVSGHLSLVGVNNEGITEPLMNYIFNNDTCIVSIDVIEHSNLRIKWSSSDINKNTPPRLDYIRVLAEPTGELTFRPDLYQYGYNDTLEQSQNFQFSVMFQNISAVDMDSVLIKYYTVANYHAPEYMRVKPLFAGDSMILPMISIPTNNLIANQTLIVELNPDKDQMETCLANNYIVVPFYVIYDIVSNVQIEQIEQFSFLNFPNPVKDETRFLIKIANEQLDIETMTIDIIDIKGQVVKRLNNQYFESDTDGKVVTKSWNARDDFGNNLATGVYFSVLHAKDENGISKSFTSKSGIQIIR
jgi:hypothetical protein